MTIKEQYLNLKENFMSNNLGVYMSTIQRDYFGVQLDITYSVYNEESIVEYIEHKGVKIQDLLEDVVLDWAEMQAEDDMIDPDEDNYDPIDAELGGNYGGTD